MLHKQLYSSLPGPVVGVEADVADLVIRRRLPKVLDPRVNPSLLAARQRQHGAAKLPRNCAAEVCGGDNCRGVHGLAEHPQRMVCTHKLPVRKGNLEITGSSGDCLCIRGN